MSVFNLLILVFSIPAFADFKEVDSADLQFSAHLIAENIKECLINEKISRISEIVVSNRTSQHLDGDEFSGFIKQELDLKGTSKNEAQMKLKIVSSISENQKSYEGQYVITVVTTFKEKQICNKTLTLRKIAEISSK